MLTFLAADVDIKNRSALAERKTQKSVCIKITDKACHCKYLLPIRMLFAAAVNVKQDD